MYKISWGRKSDIFHKTYIIVPDVHSLFETHFIISGYGRDDGCTPANIVVTNLDGVVIDITKGLANAASHCT